MNRKLTTEEKILRELLTKTFVPKASLLLLGDSRLIYKVLHSLQEHKFIKERSLVEKTSLGRVTTDYLFLTQEGYEYAWKEKHQSIPVWLQDLPFIEDTNVNVPLKNENTAKHYLPVAATSVMLGQEQMIPPLTLILRAKFQKQCNLIQTIQKVRMTRK